MLTSRDFPIGHRTGHLVACQPAIPIARERLFIPYMGPKVQFVWRIRLRSSRYSEFGASGPRYLYAGLRCSRQPELQPKMGKAGSWKFVESLEGMSCWTLQVHSTGSDLEKHL